MTIGGRLKAAAFIADCLGMQYSTGPRRGVRHLHSLSCDPRLQQLYMLNKKAMGGTCLKSSENSLDLHGVQNQFYKPLQSHEIIDSTLVSRTGLVVELCSARCPMHGAHAGPQGTAYLLCCTIWDTETCLHISCCEAMR